MVLRSELKARITPASKAFTWLLRGWLVGGVGIFLITTGLVYPPGPTLGAADLPPRILYWHSYVFLVELPIAAILMSSFVRHQEWRAPPGRYVPGRTYPVFSSWNLSAMAVLAALYAVAGLPTGITWIDFVAIITALMAAYFGSVIAFFGISVGAFIRGAVGWLPPGVPFAGIVAFAISDASRWAIIGAIYWWIVRRGRGLSTAGYWATILPITIFIHASGIIIQFFARAPLETFEFLLGLMATWYPTSIASIIVGLAAGEAAYRATTRRAVTA